MRKENEYFSREEIVEKLVQAKQIIESCLSTLTDKKTSVVKTVQKKEKAIPVNRIDFSLPIRPFIKRYASKLSGPKKFTLVLAHLVKGDEKKEITLDAIQKEWGKMTVLLGGSFNRFYTGKAKENDWVETKKQGSYNLRPSWRGIFE